MAARSLRCVAIAYRSFDLEKVPNHEEQQDQWVLPENDLVLLSIVGIKVNNMKTDIFSCCCQLFLAVYGNLAFDYTSCFELHFLILI